MKQKQLENLLSELKYSSRVHPDPLFKINARKRIMNRIASMEYVSVARPVTVNPFHIYKPFRLAFTALSIFLLLGCGTVFASQSSLPTEPLYPIKTASEDLLLNAALLPSWKKELSSIYVNRRLEEVEEVQKKYGEDAYRNALVNFEESLDKAKKYGNSSEELEKLGTPQKKFEEKIITNPGGSGQVDKDNVKGSTTRQDKPRIQQPQESKLKDVQPKPEELKNQTNSSQNSKSEKGNPLPKK